MQSPGLQFPSVCRVRYDADEATIEYRLPSWQRRARSCRTEPDARSGWLPTLTNSDARAPSDAGGKRHAATDVWVPFADEEAADSGHASDEEAPGFGEQLDGAAGRRTRIQFDLGGREAEAERQGGGFGRGFADDTALGYGAASRRGVRTRPSAAGGAVSASRLTHLSAWSAVTSLTLRSLAYDSGVGSSEAADGELQWVDDLRRWIGVREETSYLSFVNQAQLGQKQKSAFAYDEEELQRRRRQRATTEQELCDRFLAHFHLSQDGRALGSDAERPKRRQRRQQRQQQQQQQQQQQAPRPQLWKPPPPPKQRQRPKLYTQPRRDSPEVPQAEPQTAVEVEEKQSPPVPSTSQEPQQEEATQPPTEAPPPQPETPLSMPETPELEPSDEAEEDAADADAETGEEQQQQQEEEEEEDEGKEENYLEQDESEGSRAGESQTEMSQTDISQTEGSVSGSKSLSDAEASEEEASSTSSEDGSDESGAGQGAELDTATDAAAAKLPTPPPPQRTASPPIVAPPPRIIRRVPEKKVRMAPTKRVAQFSERVVDVANARNESLTAEPDSDDEEAEGGAQPQARDPPPQPPPLPPVPDLPSHEHQPPLKPAADMPLQSRVPKELYRRWGAKRIKKDRELEAERQRLAELRRQKAEEIAKRLKRLIPEGSMDADGPRYEEYGWLAKYCILNRQNVQMFTGTFRAVDIEDRGFLYPDEVLIGLKAVNNQLTEAEELYIFRVLEICGYRLKAGADCKLFCVIAALSQRIASLDTWIRNAINEISYKLLDMKLFLCKSLWESCVPEGLKTMSIDQLALELLAGGVSDKHIQEVRMRLGHTRQFDLIDFLTYIPLFIMLHSSIVDNPLSTERDK